MGARQAGFKNRPLCDDVDLSGLADRLEGYSGADITNLCEKAAADAFLRAVHKVEEAPVIRMSDLEQVMTETRPSVTPDNLTRFLEYRDQS